MKSNAKGAEFERTICRRLSEWWSAGERDDIFWRTSTSGGRATFRTTKGKSTYGQYGDLQATDPVGKPLLELVCFELKCGYPDVSVGDLVDTVYGGKVWASWIKKARTSAAGAGCPYWMIVFKKGRRQSMAIYPRALHDEFASAGIQGAWTNLRTRALLMCPGVEGTTGGLAVTPLEDFLHAVSPVDVQKVSASRMRK